MALSRGIKHAGIIHVCVICVANVWPWLSIYMGWVQVILSETLSYVTPFNIFLLNVNFNKSTIGLNAFLMLYMLVKCQDNLRLITMSLI